MAQIGKWIRETEEPAPLIAPVIIRPAETPVEVPTWLDPNKVAVPVRIGGEIEWLSKVIAGTG